MDEDFACFSRAAALEALAEIAHAGDERVIAVGISHAIPVGHAHAGDAGLLPSGAAVNVAAMCLVGKLSTLHDARTVETLLRCLDAQSCEVVKAAVKTLIIVAGQGEPRTIAKLQSYLSQPSWERRKMAIECLSEAGVQGDDSIISSVFPLLQDRDPRVRRAAAKAVNSLNVLAPNTDDDVYFECLCETGVQGGDSRISCGSHQKDPHGKRAAADAVNCLDQDTDVDACLRFAQPNRSKGGC